MKFLSRILPIQRYLFFSISDTRYEPMLVRSSTTLLIGTLPSHCQRIFVRATPDNVKLDVQVESTVTNKDVVHQRSKNDGEFVSPAIVNANTAQARSEGSVVSAADTKSSTRPEETCTDDDGSDWPDGNLTSKEDYREQQLAKNYYSLSYPTPILLKDMFQRTAYQNSICKKSFSNGVVGFGIENFLSYAAHFCRHEAAQNGAQIISVGSGDGVVDAEIVATYRKHFDEEIEITLVDPDPAHKVHFKTVDELIKGRPNVVGNCVALVIWPESASCNDGYDVDAIRKLQPLAALIVYEATLVSGSRKFVRFLQREIKDDVWCTFWDSSDEDEEKDDVKLDNYVVEKVASQEVYLDAGRKVNLGASIGKVGPFFTTKPATPSHHLRMVKLKRRLPR